LKFGAILLQMETRLLLTAYKKSLAPCLMAPSPNPMIHCLATISHDWHTM